MFKNLIATTRQWSPGWLIVVTLGISIFAFQNCAPSFVSSASHAVSSGSGSSANQVTPDVPLNPAGPLSIYIRNTTLNQGEDPTFRVELNRVSTSDVTFDVETKAGSAIPSVDYIDTKRSLKILRGQLSVDFRVPAHVASIATADKSLSAVIKLSPNAIIAQAEGTAIIKAGRKLILFTQISADSYEMSCGLTPQKTVKCWGSQVIVPTDIVGLSAIKQVASHGFHACAVTGADNVKCWGANNFGQLGNGTTDVSSIPVDVVGVANVKQIVLGDTSSCALSYAGDVKCWGDVYNRGTVATNSTMIAGLANVVQISLGFALLSDGSVISFDGRSLGLSGIKQISGTLNHYFCALTNTNTVKCASLFNDNGQNGDGTTSPHRDAQGNAVPVDVVSLNGVTQISTSNGGSCAALDSGRVKCWGYPGLNVQGSNSLLPQEIPGVSAAVAISGSCTLNSDGTSKCWNPGADGAAGVNVSSLIPYDSSRATNVKQVAGNYFLDVNGAVHATAKPSDIFAGLTGIKSISGSDENICAITAGDTIKCWGQNNFGQLGNGITTEPGQMNLPTDVVGVTGALQVVASTYSSCALVVGGTIKCWGMNSFGQLGNGGNSSPILVPTNVVGITGAKQLAIAAMGACAVTSTDSVKCWGLNDSGQLGCGVVPVYTGHIYMRRKA